MPFYYRTEPIDRREAEPVGLTTSLAIQWYGAAGNIVNVGNHSEDFGEKDLGQAVDKQQLMIAEGDELKPVEGGHKIFFGDLEKAQEVIQASVEGRLFLKSAATGQIKQIQTEIEGSGSDMTFSMSLSRALDRPPWVQPPAPEIEVAAPPQRPESPAWWKYVIAFFSSSSQSAKDIAQYKKDLAEYEKYVQETAQTASAENTEPVQTNASSQPEQAASRQNPQVGVKLDGLSTAEFRQQLEAMDRRCADVKLSVETLHTNRKTEPEIRAMMLDYVQCKAAQKFLSEVKGQPDQEAFLQANQGRVANMMQGIKSHMAERFNGDLKGTVEKLADPNAKLPEKMPLRNDLQMFTKFGHSDYESAALAKAASKNGTEKSGEEMKPEMEMGAVKVEGAKPKEPVVPGGP